MLSHMIWILNNTLSKCGKNMLAFLPRICVWFFAVITPNLLLVLAGDPSHAINGQVTAASSQFESGSDSARRLPNIVYIMADELAYYELSHMGNPYIRTPSIDQMAREGVRFTNALAAAPVCAPLRCALMTGKHMGHASVRANGGGTPLRSEETTIADLLKSQGYATGGFGKWGAGGRDSTGVPERHGFDTFFGYYDQVHAHSFYPPYLIRNSEEVVLEGNIGGRSGQTYSHYQIMDEALDFIRENKEQPFFCYLPITPPHGMYDIPKDDPAWKLYSDDAWMQDPQIDQDVKNYAAMVSMVDRNLQQVLDLLDELNLADNTIVFFTGDNGGQDRFRSKDHPRGFFGPNVNPKNGVEFRAGKGSLYEGGLRIPFIARWPGKIEAGSVSDHLFYQVDVLATLAELAEAAVPKDTDGISILPTLLGEAAAGHPQLNHPFLYWEFGPQTAVRIGDWKGVKPKPNAEWEIYNLAVDPSEANNIAAENLAWVARMETAAKQSHEPVRPGSFVTEERHQRDRNAKWGTAKRPVRQGNRKNGNIRRIKSKRRVPAEQVKVVSFSSENVANNKLANHAVDGNPETLWHTWFSDGLAQPPHNLVIDLGKDRTLTSIHYLTRQDRGWNGSFGEIAISMSHDPQNFAEPFVRHEFAKTKAPQVLKFDEPITARYLKIQIETEVNGKAWASAADIGFIEK